MKKLLMLAVALAGATGGFASNEIERGAGALPNLKALYLTGGDLHIPDNQTLSLEVLYVSPAANPLHIPHTSVWNAQKLEGDGTILLEGELNIGDCSSASRQYQNVSLVYDEGLRIEVLPGGSMRAALSVAEKIRSVG